MKSALATFALYTLSCHAMTIFDVQFTTEAGPAGTFPSPFAGQTVTLQGVVTATSFQGYSRSFFMSSTDGGSWNGIFVFQPPYYTNIGDLVEITGTVYEYYGMTEINNIIALSILSVNNPIPDPVQTSTESIHSGEEYEGVLVKIPNVSVVAEVDMHGQWYVTDNVITCQIDNDLFSNDHYSIGHFFDWIVGVVDYSYNEFAINPRNLSDLGSEADFTITDPILNLSNNRYYLMLSQSGWTVAENLARSIGGYITVINNSDENNWVLSTFANYNNTPRTLWIGFTDRNTEGNWLWNTGDESAYANWASGEPNNVNGTEHFTHIYDFSRPSNFVGKWNDYSDQTSEYGVPLHGVVEFDRLQPGISASPQFGHNELIVQFHDESIGHATSWQWDFNGDGQVDSHIRNPVYSFTDPGLYDVTLIVSNYVETDSLTLDNLIVVQNYEIQAPEIQDFLITDNIVMLSWNSVPYVDYYLIYQGLQPYGCFNFVNYVSGLSYSETIDTSIRSKLFYKIIGFDGTMNDLLSFITNNPNIH